VEYSLPILSQNQARLSRLGIGLDRAMHSNCNTVIRNYWYDCDKEDCD